ncbi:Uncharacterized protein APZ42_012370 [Daphnia magna]|uniref:Apple domain-containing protein n=1 Tax=Daphnia magna TaxID=35525 RepID=A0A0P4XEQ9_9CRUS|nr:Uncharacterized protein APZ42_012370 [Daphnia magna]
MAKMAPKFASVLLIGLMMGLVVGDDQGEQPIMADRQGVYITEPITLGTSVTIFIYRLNCDFVGNDIEYYRRANSYSQCANLCANNNLCTHFTFNFVGNYCFMKRTKADTLKQPTSHDQGICGFFPTRLKNVEMKNEEK